MPHTAGFAFRASRRRRLKPSPAKHLALARTCSNSAQANLVEVGPTSADSGRHLVEYNGHRTNMCRNVQLRSKSANCSPKVLKNGRFREIAGQCRSTSKIESRPSHIGPHWANLGPNSTGFGPISAVGPDLWMGFCGGDRRLLTIRVVKV